MIAAATRTAVRWVTTLEPPRCGQAEPTRRGIAPAARRTIAPVYRTIGLRASFAVMGKVGVRVRDPGAAEERDPDDQGEVRREAPVAPDEGDREGEEEQETGRATRATCRRAPRARGGVRPARGRRSRRGRAPTAPRPLTSCARYHSRQGTAAATTTSATAPRGGQALPSATATKRCGGCDGDRRRTGGPLASSASRPRGAPRRRRAASRDRRRARARAAPRRATKSTSTRTSACGVRRRSPKRGTTSTTRSDGQRTQAGT